MNLSFEKIERTHLTDDNGYELGYFGRNAFTGELRFIPDVDAIIEGYTLSQLMTMCIAMQTEALDDDE